MKATIKFDLDEERESFENFMQAQKMYCALTNMKDKLRSFCKYSDKQYIDKDKLRDLFFEILSEEGVEL